MVQSPQTGDKEVNIVKAKEPTKRGSSRNRAPRSTPKENVLCEPSQKGTVSDFTFDPPELEVFTNQYPMHGSNRERVEGYKHKILIPEYTSVCPKTGQPDYGTISIEYCPDAFCVELKSLKLYIQAFRNAGMFYEVLVNRIADDFWRASRPFWVVVIGEMRPRGGISSVVSAVRRRPVESLPYALRPSFT